MVTVAIRVASGHFCQTVQGHDRVVELRALANSTDRGRGLDPESKEGLFFALPTFTGGDAKEHLRNRSVPPRISVPPKITLINDPKGPSWTLMLSLKEVKLPLRPLIGEFGAIQLIRNHRTRFMGIEDDARCTVMIGESVLIRTRHLLGYCGFQ